MTTRVQHGVDFTGPQAPALAETDKFERDELGIRTDPRADACGEHEHDFATDDLQRAPTAAICANCGLSGETIQHWLSHETPIVCDGCGDIVYEDAHEMELPENRGQLFCVNCRS